MTLYVERPAYPLRWAGTPGTTTISSSTPEPWPEDKAREYKRDAARRGLVVNLYEKRGKRLYLVF